MNNTSQCNCYSEKTSIKIYYIRGSFWNRKVEVGLGGNRGRRKVEPRDRIQIENRVRGTNSIGLLKNLERRE